MRTALVLTIGLALAAPFTVVAQTPPSADDGYGRFLEQYRLPPVDVPAPPGYDENIPDPLVADPVDQVSANAVLEPAEETYSIWWEPWRKWEGSFEMGLNGTQGNSETFNVQFGAKLKRETDFAKSKFEANYIDQSSAGVITAKNVIAEGRIEFPIGDSPWSSYVHVFGEYDEFKAFDYRLTGDAGLGYAFLDTDSTTLKARVGGGTSKEFGGVNEDPIPELVFGGEWDHKFSDRQKMSFSTDYYPNAEEFSDARINSRASWEVVVAPTWGLSLKLSAINRYDSTPGAGAKHNDLNYAFLVLWSL